MDLTPEQQEHVQGMIAESLAKQQVEHEESIKGLKQNNQDLIAEKRAAQESAQQAVDEKAEAEKKRLTEGGEYKRLYEDQLKINDEKDAGIKERDERDKTNTINSFANTMAVELSGGLSPNAVKTSAGLLAKSVSIGADGKPQWNIDGVPADEEFIKTQFIKKHDYLVAGSGSSGSDAGQSKSGGGAGSKKEWSKMTAAEKADHLDNK